MREADHPPESFNDNRLTRRVKMKLESKYDFGDVLYGIYYGIKQIIENCGFCGGSGSIKGLDDSTKICLECYGRGTKNRLERTKWNVKDGVLTVGQIRVEVTNEQPGADPDSIFDNYGPQKADYIEQYMCLETGIHSGTLHPVAHLWPSREEAQAECDSLNKEEGLA